MQIVTVSLQSHRSLHSIYLNPLPLSSLLSIPPRTHLARPQHTRQRALLRARNRQAIHALNLDPHARIRAVVAR